MQEFWGQDSISKISYISYSSTDEDDRAYLIHDTPSGTSLSVWPKTIEFGFHEINDDKKIAKAIDFFLTD